MGSEKPKISRKEAVEIYRLMRLIRRTEEILTEEYHRFDEMKCPIHFCIGQEATPAALSLVLRSSDYLITHYRSHGYYLAKGASLDRMVAEFFGKATGANGGLAGSMELASHEDHFFSGAIVGGPVMIALGSAFAQKYQGADDITIAVQGDGAMDEGVTYEVLNMAAVHGLPLLIICENNLYAAHSPVAERSRSVRLSDRARAFGLEAIDLDGDEPLKLAERLRDLVARLRGGRGPLFLEIQTYRYCGHVGPENDDVLEYRPSEELARWQAGDPLKRLREALPAHGVPATELDAADAEVDRRVRDALAQARAAPFPTIEWALGLIRSDTYSPVVSSFLDDSRAAFDSDQAESKLAPY